MVPSVTATPPPFVRLAAHPLRWSLLAALAEGDHRVRELVSRVGEPQNLVSYHLRLLRAGGLVTARRSAYDGRDTYYHLDLERCADALGAVGAALHPALAHETGRPPTPGRSRRRPAVLFVCTGNSARSPIAEMLLRHRSAGAVVTVSAGTRPRDRMHPHAVRVLHEMVGVDIGDRTPRHIDAVPRRRFDHVVTLCDKAREHVPELPHHPRRIHWSLDDPASEGADGGYAVFEDVAADIDVRIRHLLPVLVSTTAEEETP